MVWRFSLSSSSVIYNLRKGEKCNEINYPGVAYEGAALEHMTRDSRRGHYAEYHLDFRIQQVANAPPISDNNVGRLNSFKDSTYPFKLASKVSYWAVFRWSGT